MFLNIKHAHIHRVGLKKLRSNNHLWAVQLKLMSQPMQLSKMGISI